MRRKGLLCLLQNDGIIRSQSEPRPAWLCLLPSHGLCLCIFVFFVFFGDLNLADEVRNCVIIAKTGRRGREPCHSGWWQHKENLSAILLVTFDSDLMMQRPEMFIYTSETSGSSVMLETQGFFFFWLKLDPDFHAKNKTNNCHSLNPMSRSRLTTVKPHCQTSSDGYLTMAMAEDQPLLTVRLRFPMQIKLCGRTYRVSCHHKTSSPPNSALLWLRWLDRSHFKWKKKSYRVSRRSGIWPEPISWGEHT